MFPEDKLEIVRLYCADILTGLGEEYDWNIVCPMIYALYCIKSDTVLNNKYKEQIREILGLQVITS